MLQQCKGRDESGLFIDKWILYDKALHMRQIHPPLPEQHASTVLEFDICGHRGAEWLASSHFFDQYARYMVYSSAPRLQPRADWTWSKGW